MSVSELEASEAADLTQAEGGNQQHQRLRRDDSQEPSVVPGLEWQECWDDGWCTVYVVVTWCMVTCWPLTSTAQLLLQYPYRRVSVGDTGVCIRSTSHCAAAGRCYG